MPVDWNLAVGDSEGGGDIEVLPLTSLNDRGFEAFLLPPKYVIGIIASINPIS